MSYCVFNTHTGSVCVENIKDLKSGPNYVIRLFNSLGDVERFLKTFNLPNEDEYLVYKVELTPVRRVTLKQSIDIVDVND